MVATRFEAFPVEWPELASAPGGLLYRGLGRWDDQIIRPPAGWFRFGKCSRLPLNKPTADILPHPPPASCAARSISVLRSASFRRGVVLGFRLEKPGRLIASEGGRSEPTGSAQDDLADATPADEKDHELVGKGTREGTLDSQSLLRPHPTPFIRHATAAGGWRGTRSVGCG